MTILSAFNGSDNKKVSMMRVLTFMVVGSILGIFILHNIMSIIHGGGFVSIGYQEAVIIFGALGIKAYQSKVENGDSSVTPETTDALPVDKKE